MRRVLIACAVVAVATGAVWFAWSCVSASAEPMIAEDGFEWPARRLTARREILTRVPAEQQDNPALVCLIDFALAEQDYHTTMPRRRFATPLRLTDETFWHRRGAHAMLPAPYSAPTSGVYGFEFHGRGCIGEEYAPVMECDSFVYVAVPKRPLQPGHGRPPAYALYGDDLRIRYREHGETPEERDNAISTVPAVAVATPTSGSGLSSLLPHWLTGASEAAATEATALQDLRDAASAEKIWRELMNDSPKFLPPEQLADAGMFARASIPEPLLPTRFQRSQRDGYTFEFIGEHLVTESPRSDIFHPLYERFVYVARPSTRGGRTLALYPDGGIFATKASRVPTPADETIDAPRP